VLSAVSTENLVQAVVNEQVHILTQIPGVGKKTAQRVIIELKDKLAKSQLAGSTSIIENNPLNHNEMDDALQALVALGYNSVEAKKALAKIPSKEGITSEEIIRLALKELMRF
jgi:Holliday junction DNA helicase RuvA